MSINMISRALGLLGVLLILRVTAAADNVDFNSLTSLDPLFIHPSFANNSTLTDGVGINGSRGLAYNNSIVGGASDLRIYTPFVIHPDTASWQVSILYKGTDGFSLGNPMVGVLGPDSRYYGDSRYPDGFSLPDRSYGAIYATVQDNGLNLFAANGSSLESVGIPGSFDSSWYKLELQVDYLGTTSNVLNTYHIRATVSQSDNSGGVGATVAQVEHTLTTVQFQGIPDIYGFFGIDTPDYFNWEGPGFSGAIDNFSVTSVPEPSPALLTVLTAAALLLRRPSSRERA